MSLRCQFLDWNFSRTGSAREEVRRMKLTKPKRRKWKGNTAGLGIAYVHRSVCLSVSLCLSVSVSLLDHYSFQLISMTSLCSSKHVVNFSLSLSPPFSSLFFSVSFSVSVSPVSLSVCLSLSLFLSLSLSLSVHPPSLSLLPPPSSPSYILAYSSIKREKLFFFFFFSRVETKE